MMKKITVTVSGLSPFQMEVDYRPEKSELGNILRALSCATEIAAREALKIGEEISVDIRRETELPLHLTDCEPADTGGTVYEAVFELNDGKKNPRLFGSRPTEGERRLLPLCSYQRSERAGYRGG